MDVLIAAAIILSILCSCGIGGGETSETAEATAESTPTATAEPTATPEPTPDPDESIISEMGLTNVGRTVAESAETKMKTEEDATTIYVKDYGAVGDGETDDSKAIKNAITALRKSPKGSKLVFESDTSYYCGNSGAALTFSGITDRMVEGNNTTILIDAPAKFMDMTSCRRFVVSGFNFNYKTKPYAISTGVTDIDTKKNTAVITFDRDLGIKKSFTAPSAEFFGVLSRDDGRYHMSITSIRLTDEATHTYKVTFNNTFGNISSRVEALGTYAFICPMPNVGHTVETAFGIYTNEDITLKNCNVYSYSKFGVHVRLNSGVVLFENFNMVADPAEKNENCRIVGWRDGFHCKENRAQLIWKDCTLEWLYDDVFNISASLLKVTEVDEKGYVHIMWPESGGTYGNIEKGDTMSFYDTSTGKLLGTSVVTKASGDKVILQDEISGIKEGIVAVDDSLGAPNSEIIGCSIHGTLRFRSPMYIADSEIWCTRMWIGMENVGTTSGEGPCSGNILFSNCRFKFDNSSSIYIHILCGNTKGASKLKKGTASQDEIYHVKNIVFKGCEINTAQIELADAQQYATDTIIIRD